MGSGHSKKYLKMKKRLQMKKSATLDPYMKNEHKRRRYTGKISQKEAEKYIGIKVKDSKPLRLMIAHDNRKKYYTVSAHCLANLLDRHSSIEVIYDKKVWKKGQKDTPTAIDRKERDMVRYADVVVRIINPSKKTGGRNEGAVREMRKAIKQSKPLIEIYKYGAKDTPNRPERERNYGKRVVVRLKRGEPLLNGFKKGLKELIEKGLLDRELEFL